MCVEDQWPMPPTRPCSTTVIITIIIIIIIIIIYVLHIIFIINIIIIITMIVIINILIIQARDPAPSHLQDHARLHRRRAGREARFE